MKNLLVFASLIFSFASCTHIEGSGNVVTEKRDVGNFKGVSAGGGFEVDIQIGSTPSVIVEADDNLIQYIETRVSGNVLKIENRDDFSLADGTLKVHVTAPEITEIKSSGAADIKAKDLLKSNSKISLDASGAGKIEAEVDAPEVETEASGAANVEVSGKTREYKAHASGSGNIKSGKLLSEEADAEASGAGSIYIHASVKLRAEASGAGSINYRGGANVQQKTSGAGSVKQDD